MKIEGNLALEFFELVRNLFRPVRKGVSKTLVSSYFPTIVLRYRTFE
jgi:hypothetical protein